MTDADGEHTLEFLLAFNGRIHWLEQGYYLKFEIKRVDVSALRPHGLSYSFTLHDPEGERILGFDNAHTVKPRGARYKKSPAAADHWHRTSGDKGRPYKFQSAEKLIEDFFAEVRKILEERQISDEVIDVSEKGKSP